MAESQRLRAAGQARPWPWTADVPDALVGGLVAVALVVAIFIGSNSFTNFDSALIGYAVTIVVLTFALVAHFGRWLRMPPTRRYWRRGWYLFFWKGSLSQLARAIGGQLLGQGFIRRRGLVRWLAHQCLFWGVMASTAITFPLVFGWLAFRLEPGTDDVYRMLVFGLPTVTFDATSFLGWSLFHALDYTALLVIAGCAMFLWRRFRDRAVIATQRLGHDLVPLLMLLVISVTGLGLTASAALFGGSYYGFLVVAHMASVVLSLVFIPFGKFFHVVQRPASVGIQLYAELGASANPRPCARCGQELASDIFVTDLQATLAELGQDYRYNESVEGSAQLTELCPRCKRVVRGTAYFALSGQRMGQ